ncbi:MAG: hypothetical protein Athens041674_342 [Parcubacteria group bacterium Athens0416_74]|nr:MAG: hypothetical protein Athens041674_342 [Parcubacteria group bacterium Athens0416_74]
MSDHHDDHSHQEHKPHPDQFDDDRRITYFASTHTRGKREMFGIRAVDRGKHIYVIGKTGMGKSTMLENMAIQDIQNGEGIAFIDPHGSTAEKLLDFIPQERISDVVYFAPFDTDYPLGFNVMEDVGYDKRHLVVSGLMGALKRIWVDAWSARMEYILQNTLLALLEYPDSTLLDVNRMLTNKTFRNAVIEVITDPIVKAFWVEEFAAFTDTYTREATPAIQNKIGQFTANPLIRNIVGQAKSSFDLRKIMDEKKIFIVNLSKGRMGETNASLLGSMLTVKIYLAAMSRADEPAARMAKLPRFYFYVDEFQSMMNEAFADILSESRKYKLALTLANQYIEQMEEEVRDAVFGNVGTLIVFRVGPFDAEVLETVFEPTFTPEDLVNLGIGQIYLTLMIDGVGSAPFSSETIPPIEPPHVTYRDDVIMTSRHAYGRPKAAVEKHIHEKQAEFIPPPREKKEKRDFRPSGPRYEPSPAVAPIEKLRESRPMPQPAPVTVRHEAPQPFPQRSDAPRREQKEVEHRGSLRDAIEKARAEGIASTSLPPQPSRSPLDMMREKKAHKHGQQPQQPRAQEHRGQERREHVPQPPHQDQRHPPKSEHADNPKRPEGRENDERPRHEHVGEVSHQVLQRVINGRGGHVRDNDDL